MFNMGSEHRRELRMMAIELQMQKNMLQYHLDCLDRAGLASMISWNYARGDVYWDLTVDGRRYVVQHDLK
jgi:hypothetical protein